MFIIDAHCHVSPHWYEPVESLLFHMDRNGVEQAILVQHVGQFNNEYLFECMRRFPGRFAAVVLVDTSDPKATGILEHLSERGARGVRFHVNTRSPDGDPLAIWRKADELRLPVSCCGKKKEFASEEFANLVQTLPNLPIVIEHLGLGAGTAPGDETTPYELQRKIFALSRFPNVYIKIHGLGEFCRRTMPVSEPFPFERPIPPFLEMAYEAFGPGRMMWGSDYPPVSGREGYSNALRLVRNQLESVPQRDKDLIFGGVALDLFDLQDQVTTSANLSSMRAYR